MTDTTKLAASTRPAWADDRWARLSRTTGVLGLASVVVIFATIIALSIGEPPFTGTTEQVYAFLLRQGEGWPTVANAVLTVGAIGLIWFVVGLTLLLARAEGSPPLRSGAAMVSGVLLPAYVLAEASWEAAAYRGAETDPALARYAFDVTSLGFANVWVAMGSFAIACGSVVLGTRVLGRWLGWWAVVAGIGLIVSRFVWTSDLWLGPYFLFWIWVIVICVQLLRGRAVLHTKEVFDA